MESASKAAEGSSIAHARRTSADRDYPRRGPENRDLPSWSEGHQVVMHRSDSLAVQISPLDTLETDTQAS